MRPTLDIFKNKHTGEFIIVNFAPRPLYGGSVGWGPTVHLEPEVMRKRGLEVLLANLEGFQQRDGSLGCEIQMMTREQRRKFDSDHLLVGVRQESPELIALQPMRPTNPAGFIGNRRHEISVSVPCSAGAFFDKLNSAFDRAG
jgi:hypothetical protein